MRLWTCVLAFACLACAVPARRVSAPAAQAAQFDDFVLTATLLEAMPADVPQMERFAGTLAGTPFLEAALERDLHECRIALRTRAGWYRGSSLCLGGAAVRVQRAQIVTTPGPILALSYSVEEPTRAETRQYVVFCAAPGDGRPSCTHGILHEWAVQPPSAITHWRREWRVDPSWDVRLTCLTREARGCQDEHRALRFPVSTAQDPVLTGTLLQGPFPHESFQYRGEDGLTLDSYADIVLRSRGALDGSKLLDAHLRCGATRSPHPDRCRVVIQTQGGWFFASHMLADRVRPDSVAVEVVRRARAPVVVLRYDAERNGRERWSYVVPCVLDPSGRPACTREIPIAHEDGTNWRRSWSIDEHDVMELRCESPRTCHDERVELVFARMPH